MSFNLKKNITCFFLFTLLLSLLSSGCGFLQMPWQNKTVVTYVAMGETLETAKPVLMSLCSTGEIGPNDCTEVREAYNEAVKIYHELGTMAAFALDSGDVGGYNNDKQELLALLETINQFILDHQ